MCKVLKIKNIFFVIKCFRGIGVNGSSMPLLFFDISATVIHISLFLMSPTPRQMFPQWIIPPASFHFKILIHSQNDGPLF